MESQLCLTYLRERRLVPLRVSWPRCYRWRPSWPCSPARSETSPRPLWDPALDSQNRSSRSYKDKHRCIVRHVWIFRAKCTREKTVPGVFTIGYLPIAHFFEDKCPSRNAHHGFIPIMKVYPSCFAHQEKSPPAFIPITILPIDWWTFTHHIFTHQRIAHPNK